MVGVPQSDKSPFCREFKSLDELLDTLIKYKPSTSLYDDVQGASQSVHSSEDNVEGELDLSLSNDEVLLKKIDQFAKEMLVLDGDHDEKSDVMDNEDDIREDDDSGSDTLLPTVESTIPSTQLMSCVRSLMQADLLLYKLDVS